jgi:phosphohistidine phosphatase SixA
MKLKKVFGLLIISVLIVSCGESENSKTQTFYLVRHAEKDLSDTTENPQLTDEGVQRAFNLVSVLKDVKVDAIFSTKYDRNINTVKPLSGKTHKEIEIYEWHDWTPTVDKITKEKSLEIIVICGHGDNLLPMIEHLGGTKPQESLGHHEYDKIFKVTVFEDSTSVEVIVF